MKDNLGKRSRREDPTYKQENTNIFVNNHFQSFLFEESE